MYVNELLEKYYANISYALQEGIESAALPGLLRLNRRIGQRLYEALIKPVKAYLEAGKLLLIVPYGLLHYVPYNTLYSGKRYLIQEHEITLLPSAGIITRPGVSRKPGILILTHSHNGKIPHTRIEAGVISRMFESRVCIDQDAGQKQLDRTPVQVLHIAAHGRHRIDQPGLSYISFEDGNLYADDLLQKDLSYELVTLSACETGKIAVKKSEEIMGLIRGILFAGAQSLVVSMWSIDDEITAQYMTRFYALLKKGESKAVALQMTQQYLISEKPYLHPAFWGAFQLVGSPGPLSEQHKQ